MKGDKDLYIWLLTCSFSAFEAILYAAQSLFKRAPALKEPYSALNIED